MWNGMRIMTESIAQGIQQQADPQVDLKLYKLLRRQPREAKIHQRLVGLISRFGLRA